jgi:hypothetical protein
VLPIPVLIGMDGLDALLAPWLAHAPVAGVAALAAAGAAGGWLLVRGAGAPVRATPPAVAAAPLPT